MKKFSHILISIIFIVSLTACSNEDKETTPTNEPPELQNASSNVLGKATWGSLTFEKK